MHAQIEQAVTLQMSMLLSDGQGRGIVGANPYNAAIAALSPFCSSITQC
jgi:hypothetical protein